MRYRHQRIALFALIAGCLSAYLLLSMLSGTALAAKQNRSQLDAAVDGMSVQSETAVEVDFSSINRILQAATVNTTVNDFFVPGTQPNQLAHEIDVSTDCSGCHTAPIYDAWRGSMMSQAARDPLLYAALEVANVDAAESGDLCLRCHIPKGWLEGRSTPTDGSSFTDVDIQEGVTCEVCHRLVDPVASATDATMAIDTAIRAQLATSGTLPSPDHQSSAMMIVDPEDNRRGPFDLGFNPHFGQTETFQTDYFNQDSSFETRSRVCATCHNVVNPVMTWTENPPGGGPAQFWPNDLDQPAPSFAEGALFPVESTYDEWVNSEYAQSGVFAPQFAGAKADGIVGACQDCHMPRSTGFGAVEGVGGVERDCSTNGCLPVHELVGGNTWAPQLLQDARWRLNSISDAAELDDAIVSARNMLTRSATISVSVNYSGQTPIASVLVVNESGHKLPTGYPEGRRMWLNLSVYDSNDNLIYESGAYDPATAILTKDPAIKVYEAKLGITSELAPVVNKPAGESFHFVLNNEYLKDNRIPPRGYTVAAFDRPGLQPVGATYEDGQYWDETNYEVPDNTSRVVASLYYQTSSKEYIDFLRENGGEDAAVLGEMWDDLKSPPEMVAQAQTTDIPDVPLIAGLAITKTVGTDADVCATTDQISTPVGTNVYYCVTIQNTGDLTLTQHTLDDPTLSFNVSFQLRLVPGASAVLTTGLFSELGPIVATTDVTNTVTFTSTYVSGMPDGVDPAGVGMPTDMNVSDTDQAIVDVQDDPTAIDEEPQPQDKRIYLPSLMAR